MASGNRRAGARRQADGFEASAPAGAAFPVAMRILILSSLLVLAIYTALAVRRIDLSPNAPAPFVEPLRGDADLLAARAQTEIVRLRLEDLR